MTEQEQHPNFRHEGQLYLVRCFICDRENWSPAVATGACAWCGWKEERTVKEGFKERGNVHFASHRDDWCHLCGKRESLLVDCFYPKNAEHGGPKDVYLRVCFECVVVMLDVIDERSKEDKEDV